MTALPPDTTVLIVDDHQLVATSLALGLRAEGVAARHEAPRGAAAVLAAARPGPGLALLDLDLGRDEQRRPIDGVALVAPLRAAGWRVLVLSGSTDRTGSAPRWPRGRSRRCPRPRRSRSCSRRCAPRSPGAR